MGKQKRREQAVVRQQVLQQRQQGTPVPAAGWAVKATSWSAPLPPPSTLIEYNNAFPGAAERIVAMAEQQSAHRRSLESKVIDGNIAAQARGQWLGFILALVVMGIGGELIFVGRNIEGFSLLAGDVASLLLAFMWGRSRSDEERRKKLEALAS